MAANLPSRPAGSEATADPATAAAGGGAETGTTLTRVAVAAAAGGAGVAAGTEEVAAAAAAEHTEPATQSEDSYDNITEGALGLTQGFVIIFHVNSTGWWAMLLLLSSPSK